MLGKMYPNANVVWPAAVQHSSGSTPCDRRGRTRRRSLPHSTACTAAPPAVSAASPAVIGSAGSPRSLAPPPGHATASGTTEFAPPASTSCPRYRRCTVHVWHSHTLPWRFDGCRIHTSCPGWCSHWGKVKPGDPWNPGCTASWQHLSRCHTCRQNQEWLVSKMAYYTLSAQRLPHSSSNEPLSIRNNGLLKSCCSCENEGWRCLLEFKSREQWLFLVLQCLGNKSSYRGLKKRHLTH